MNRRMDLSALLVAGIAAALTACGGDRPASDANHASAQDTEPALPASQLETDLPPAIRDAVLKPLTGDLDSMVERRFVRVGTTFNRSFYFVDRGVPRGVVYEYGRLMEERLNTHFKTGTSNLIHVVFVPLPREMLLPALVEGRVDLVAAQVTVTPEFRQHVDFSNPTRDSVNQVLVTGPGGPAVTTRADLSGREVFAREMGGYAGGLAALNERFKAAGKPPVEIREPPSNLEDDDLLEMVHAGLIPAIVVDDYLARFWQQVFPDIVVHDSIPLRTGGTLAVAVRKNSPQLTTALSSFMGKYGLGSAFGNQVERRYLVETKYAASATSAAARKRFETIVSLFRKYGDRYQMDFLLLAAQGFQESQLNQEARSQVGAIGVMQVMPETGAALKVGDITQLEPNIHAGVKYMRELRDRNFESEPMDDLNKELFTFAAYNAGPGRVKRLREATAKRGLDPNLWFGNVEQVASERIGRETVTYVANIFKYYIAYRLVMEENERREAAKATVKGKGKPD